MVIKAVYLHKLGKSEEKKLRSLIKKSVQIKVPRTWNKKELEKQVRDADVIVADQLSPELIKKASKLKYVIVPYSGTPPLLIEILSKFPSIKLCNTKANSEIVAEFAFALLLSLNKKILQYDKGLRKGRWEIEAEVSLLKSNTLGILGLGAVGLNIAKIAKCFSMKTIGISKDGKISRQHKRLLDYVGSEKDLKKILKKSDYVVISLPLTQETKNLIGRKEIEAMKDSAYLINIARGEIVNEKALYQALKSNKIAGAAIDVWYEYPPISKQRAKVFPSKYQFQKLTNIIMTPHSAYKCKEYSDLKMKKIAESLNRIYEGKKPTSGFY